MKYRVHIFYKRSQMTVPRDVELSYIYTYIFNDVTRNASYLTRQKVIVNKRTVN